MSVSKSARLHETVRNTPGYKRKSIYQCSVNKPSVSAEMCRALSASPDNNVICRESNCPSIWRACVVCISKKKVSFQDSVIDKETGCCERHQGGLAAEVVVKKEETKVESTEGEIAQNDERHPKTLNQILQRVMATAKPPVDIPVNKIRRFDRQPRLAFDAASLLELGESLKIVQIQPIFVRKLSKKEAEEDPHNCEYELVDGERRWRSCKVVKKELVRAVVLDISDEATQYAISAIANFGREDHTPMEEAFAIQYMRDNLLLSAGEIASSFAKSVPWVYQRIKLLELVPEVQEMLLPSDKYKRPLKITTAMLISDLAKEYSSIQIGAAAHFVNNPEITVKSAETYIHSLMEKEGLEPPKRRVYTIQGPIHTQRALVSFVNTTWDKLERVLNIPDENFLNLPVDEETRRTWKNNINSISHRLQQLTKKI